jgi:hypothetical protein
MVRLIPKDEKFYGLFIKDGEIMLETARKLEAMVTTYDRLEERVIEIQALEKQGDRVDDEIAARLERSFITPFDREDIRDLRRQGTHRGVPPAGGDHRGPGRPAARGDPEAREAPQGARTPPRDDPRPGAPG